MPDDQKRALEVKYYYRKHKIQLKNAELDYSFTSLGQTELMKTCVGNLREWFVRLWKGGGGWLQR